MTCYKCKPYVPAIFKITPLGGFTSPMLYSCARCLPRAVRDFRFNPCEVAEILLTKRRVIEKKKRGY